MIEVKREVMDRDYEGELKAVAKNIEEKAKDIMQDIDNVCEIEINIHLKPDELAYYDVVKRHVVPFIGEE